MSGFYHCLLYPVLPPTSLVTTLKNFYDLFSLCFLDLRLFFFMLKYVWVDVPTCPESHHPSQKELLLLICTLESASALVACKGSVALIHLSIQ